MCSSQNPRTRSNRLAPNETSTACNEDRQAHFSHAFVYCLLSVQSTSDSLSWSYRESTEKLNTRITILIVAHLLELVVAHWRLFGVSHTGLEKHEHRVVKVGEGRVARDRHTRLVGHLAPTRHAILAGDGCRLRQHASHVRNFVPGLTRAETHALETKIVCLATNESLPTHIFQPRRGGVFWGPARSLEQESWRRWRSFLVKRHIRCFRSASSRVSSGYMLWERRPSTTTQLGTVVWASCSVRGKRPKREYRLYVWPTYETSHVINHQELSCPCWR